MENSKRKLTVYELPYEKFILKGSENLTDVELLAILIRTGTKKFNVLEISEMILDSESEKNLLTLFKMDFKKLLKVPGIGKVKAIRILTAMELCKRVTMQRRESGLQIDRPETVAAYFMENMRHLKTEHVMLLCLDAKNRLQDTILMSQGTVNSSLVSTRELFIHALKKEAVNLLLLHNHPSGDPMPSRSDIKITQTILETSKLLDLPLIDHIIIGDNTYYSMKEHGWLNKTGKEF